MNKADRIESRKGEGYRRILVRTVYVLRGTGDRDGRYQSRGAAVEARCLARKVGTMTPVRIVGKLRWSGWGA